MDSPLYLVTSRDFFRCMQRFTISIGDAKGLANFVDDVLIWRRTRSAYGFISNIRLVPSCIDVSTADNIASAGIGESCRAWSYHSSTSARSSFCIGKMNSPPSDGVERHFIRAEWNRALAVLNASWTIPAAGSSKAALIPSVYMPSRFLLTPPFNKVCSELSVLVHPDWQCVHSPPPLLSSES